MGYWSLGLWMTMSGVLTLSYSAVGKAFPFKGVVSRNYRAVNTVKGVVLAVCSPASAVLGIASLLGTPYAGGDAWQTWLPVMAALYASTDLSAMIHNPSSARTTQVHHTLVQLFYLYLEWIDYAPTLAARAIVLYAGVSACEFIVNLRLAARGMLRGPASVWLNRTALWVYIIGTYLNLSGQLWLLCLSMSQSFSVTYLMTLIAMIGVFVDDVALMQYMWQWQPRAQDS
jgi:hypothetical protein